MQCTRCNKKTHYLVNRLCSWCYVPPVPVSYPCSVEELETELPVQPPEEPLVYEKFVTSLEEAGIKINRDSNDEIRNDKLVDLEKSVQDDLTDDLSSWIDPRFQS